MSDSLSGQLLIAMPGLKDPRFQKSVILICEFSKTSIMGLILNKELNNLKLNNLLKKINISKIDKLKNNLVYNGGPVHQGQGFILHTNDITYNTTEKIFNDVCITTSIEILQDLALNKGPESMKVFLGCSVWDYEQFHREMLENSWLTINASEELIFLNESKDNLWKKCLLKLGIKVENLTTSFGHA